MSTEIKCPFCGTIQSDCTNGGDPGEWWNSSYIPDGQCDTKCDSCKKEFTVKCDWSPNFTSEVWCSDCHEYLDEYDDYTCEHKSNKQAQE